MSQVPAESRGAEVLDDAFTDITNESTPVGDYERVDGLGEGAGYGTRSRSPRGPRSSS